MKEKINSWNPVGTKSHFTLLCSTVLATGHTEEMPYDLPFCISFYKTKFPHRSFFFYHPIVSIHRLVISRCIMLYLVV